MLNSFLYKGISSKFAYMVITIATLNPFVLNDGDAAESFAMLDSFLYKGIPSSCIWS